MIKIRDKQNIFDLVLQNTGGLNNAGFVLRENGLNFSDSMIPNSELSINYIESQKIKDNFELGRNNLSNEELPIIPPVWILDGGIWNDSGEWIDTEFWQD